MAMLAEPRRKQKWTLNPRGKHWSDDSNKFGQKMLEKMGWSSGKGLGANLDGMTDHIRCKYKNDQAGIGFSHDDMDKQWTEHQEGFNELLQKLHNGETAETTAAAESELSGKSLELKSKQSRARVHYQKFTRGKDVNKYSAKDLANIFGKKNLEDKAEEPEKAVEIKPEAEEAAAAPIGSSDSSHGVVTIKGGSISDYFKSKMSALGRKMPTEAANDSESESETRAGFGFSTPKVKSESHEGLGFSQEKSETPKKTLETHFSFVNPSDLASPPRERETPRKRKSEFAFENPALDIASPKEAKETPRKRKSDYVFDNPALQIGDGENAPENTPTKRRKSDFAFENGGLDLDYPRRGESAAAVACPEEQTKKKRKKKPKECIPPIAAGFTNEALNLESREDESSNSSQFEIARPCLGLANDALDLTDETNGRKRVTFNETLEFDTDVTSGKRKKKKNSAAGKLDKFEVDNEKLRRKKRKERREEVAESAFVNEAMDVDAGSQEASENAANERKSERARRKRERGISNLETIAEAPDEEKDSAVEVVTLDESLVGEASEDFEVLSLETPKKKKKKTKKNRLTEGPAESPENFLSTTIDISEEDVEIVGEISSVDAENTEKSKKKKKKKRKKGGDSVTEEQEEMEVAYEREATSEKGKKEKTKLKANEETKENVDTENVCASVANQEEESKKKKKLKKAKKEGDEGVAAEEKCEEVPVVRVEFSEDNAEGTGDCKVKKSKKSFKALFARSPVVNFVGSNINEIRGYGVDLK